MVYQFNWFTGLGTFQKVRYDHCVQAYNEKSFTSGSSELSIPCI